MIILYSALLHVSAVYISHILVGICSKNSNKIEEGPQQTVVSAFFLLVFCEPTPT